MMMSYYKRALQDHHLPFFEKYLVISDSNTDKDGFNRQAGYEAMKQILSMKDRPTAVFISSDVQAAGAIRALQEAGLKIPDDMAIVGFDDIELASYTIPALTTVRQPKYEMGAIAARMLLEHMQQDDLIPKRQILETELVVRSSTAAVPHLEKSHA